MTFYKPGWLGWKELNRRKLSTRLAVAILKSGITKHKPKRNPRKKWWQTSLSLFLLAGSLTTFMLIERSSGATADSGTLILEVGGGVSSPTSTDVHLPVARDVITLINQKVYGYSSTVDQTDSSPFTTANGKRVKAGIIANNCYDFGTSVKISKAVNIGPAKMDTFEVQDRMNERYNCDNWDIWFPTREAALQWGSPTLLVKILK